MTDVSGYVALTYDDGPDPGSTAALLGALRSAGARATFFDVGRRARAHPELVRAQRAAGMWVGNHSWTHPHLTGLSAARIATELARTQRALQDATGGTPTLFRPPYGDTDAVVGAVAARLGLTEVLWDADSRDWAGAGTEEIVAAASALRAGDVLLMHDGHRATVDAVPRIVEALAARGLRTGMISAASGRAVAPPSHAGTPGETEQE
ncbi:polysaccharide deacetylase family protein [Dactylosporangium sp. NPDC005555]|uniref:polysaccharide deacetylase family protein n=1 Tax=Dactylosporangium sp. NPDC005555 TaxID=3154889 RepID=UPI0033A54B23